MEDHWYQGDVRGCPQLCLWDVPTFVSLDMPPGGMDISMAIGDKGESCWETNDSKSPELPIVTGFLSSLQFVSCWLPLSFIASEF